MRQVDVKRAQQAQRAELAEAQLEAAAAQVQQLIYSFALHAGL